MSSPPTRIELRVGGERTLELLGLATAGYVWEAQVCGDPGVVEVRWERGLAAGATLPAVGISAPERATIRGARPGAVSIAFVQRRRWESLERVRGRFVVEVAVSCAAAVTR